MSKKNKIACIALLSFILINGSSFNSKANTYFVSTLGRDSCEGSIQDPWSMVFAIQNANAGDTVWMKAGNYGSLNLKFFHSGTPDQKIVFIGYKDSINDLELVNMPVNPDRYINGSYDTVFPTLSGANRAIGIGISMDNVSNIMLKNFHIRNYLIAVNISLSSDIEFENIITAYTGNLTVNTGSGIKLHHANRCLLKNCFVYNSVLEGITLVSTLPEHTTNFNSIDNCSVWCDDDSTGIISATDYYFLIGSIGKSSADSNVISNCYAERVGNLKHSGHGFSLVAYQSGEYNGSVKYNSILNSHAENISELFLLRGPETAFNTLRDCSSSSVERNFGGIIRVDASKFNLFERIETNYTGSWGAICFTRDTTVVKEYNFAAVGNKFNNCVFKNANVGIGFMGYSSAGNPKYSEQFSVDSNLITSCTFVNTTLEKDSKFVLCERKNSGNKITNSIIYGFHDYQEGNLKKSADLYFENCCVFNNDFSLRKMHNAFLIDCMEKDPLFVDFGGSNFSLSKNSPCINAGTEVEIFSDFNKNRRPSGYKFDIGAYEFQNLSDSLPLAYLTINSQNPDVYSISSEKQILTFKLYDEFGKLIREEILNDNFIKLDMSTFPSGIFLLMVIYTDNTIESVNLRK